MRESENSAVLSRLGRDCFAFLGCECYGIAVRKGVTYEQLIEGAGISGMFGAKLNLKHDSAGAPLLVDGSGAEQLPFISLTDEDDSCGMAWVDPRGGGDVVGVGVDLAARGDFPFTESRIRWYRHIFTEGEMAAIRALCPDDLDLGATLLFSAKEATFKAASQQIRTLLQAAGGDPRQFDCPYFETRDIEVCAVGEPARIEARVSYPATVLDGVWQARGIEHIGNAAAAFEFLGIGGVSVRFAIVEDKALSVAVARGSSR